MTLENRGTCMLKKWIKWRVEEGRIKPSLKLAQEGSAKDLNSCSSSSSSSSSCTCTCACASSSPCDLFLRGYSVRYICVICTRYTKRKARIWIRRKYLY